MHSPVFQSKSTRARKIPMQTRSEIKLIQVDTNNNNKYFALPVCEDYNIWGKYENENLCEASSRACANVKLYFFLFVILDFLLPFYIISHHMSSYVIKFLEYPPSSNYIVMKV